MKRHGRPLGRRTVAGRVVKESYGAAKQQHTFTVMLRLFLIFGRISRAGQPSVSCTYF